MRAVLIVLLVMWLSGCAQQPTLSQPPRAVAWSMDAKIAFTGKQQSGSAFAEFDYTPGLFGGNLRGLFGIGKTRIDCNLSYCDIASSDGETRAWLNQGNLELQANLLLPINLLPDWLLGTHTDRAQESGWQVDIDAWQEQHGVRLPQKLRLTHTTGHRLKVFITRWTPQE